MGSFLTAVFLMMILLFVARVWNQNHRKQWETLAHSLGLELMSDEFSIDFMSGTWKGNEVLVERGAFIYVSTLFKPSLIRGLSLLEANESNSTLGIQTGDAAFDARFVIFADDDEDALAFLTPKVRATLREYSDASEGIHLTEDTLKHSTLDSAQRIEASLNAQHTLIQVLQRQFAQSIFEDEKKHDEHAYAVQFETA